MIKIISSYLTRYCTYILFAQLIITPSYAKYISDFFNSFQKSDWKKHRPFYITGGYELTRHFFRHDQLVISDVHPPIYYTAGRTYPSNFNGMRLGFGTSLEDNWGLELNYTQAFATTKVTNSLRITQSNKVVVGFVTYTINPLDRLRWVMAGAAAVTSTYVTTRTLPPYEPYFSYTNSVDVDPAVAGGAIYQFNAQWAIKGILIYKIKTYNPMLRFDFIPIAMINYYP